MFIHISHSWYKNTRHLWKVFCISWTLSGFPVWANPESDISVTPTQDVDTNDILHEIETDTHTLASLAYQQPEPSFAASMDGSVQIYHDDNGYILHKDGQPYFIRGMNWGYVPIGTNYSYNFWAEPEWIIRKALDKEMALLKAMGVNSIRQYDGIPPEWVRYIYQTYGITTMINPTVGRYGVELHGNWIPVTNYQDPEIRELLKQQVRNVVAQYKDCEGVLLWLLGNENNYGLHWSSFEIEQLPKDEQYAEKAKYLYSLFGEIVDEIHQTDQKHPVAIANGDVQYIDIIAENIPNLDIFATNVYRGASVRDLYTVVEEKLGVPVFFSEFGADAYNAKEQREDHLEQAFFIREQWKEIYLNTYRLGSKNAIGGYTFQWADGWWKYLQEENLEIHDNNASWSNGGYYFDFVEGQNNMNEEWFGICAKGPADENHLFDLYPRASYYLLKDAYQMEAYSTIDENAIREHFDALNPLDYDVAYTTQVGIAKSQEYTKTRVENIRSELYGFVSDTGNQIRNIEHLQSFYVDVVSEPNDNLKGAISVNILGNVPNNRIDELYYERRGRSVRFQDSEDNIVTLTDINRVQIYQASIDWQSDNVDTTVYFRKGHYHWAHEGDFFNFYREAFYGPNPDIYNADVPIGAEFSGKNKFQHWKLVMGPQIYWGANPTAILKYYRNVGNWNLSVLHQEDISNQGAITTLTAIPEQPLRRSSLYVSKQFGKTKTEGGVLFSGWNKVGRPFQYVTDGGNYAGTNYNVIDDEIYWLDALGGKIRITRDSGPILFYGQGGYQGLVADAGSDQHVRFTGWNTRASGRGNHWHAMSGMAFTIGNLQIAPHILTQKPLIGPMPSVSASLSNNGLYTPALHPRNVFQDPFMVLENREMTSVELLFAYDQTPGTWMWYWDNDIKEDAKISGYISLVYRHQPTSRDATIGFDQQGNLFAFNVAPDATDLWEVNSKLILVSDVKSRVIVHSQIGTAQSSGGDSRVINFYRVQLRGWHKNLHSDLQFKINDWGPFDYHKVYNLTFPLQMIGRFEVGMVQPRFGEQYPHIGLLTKYRITDSYSPENIPLEYVHTMWNNDWGHQYEVGAYVSFTR